MDNVNIYNKAIALLRSQGCISASRIQRGLGVGYCTAEKILDELIKKEHLVQGATKLTWQFKNNIPE